MHRGRRRPILPTSRCGERICTTDDPLSDAGKRAAGETGLGVFYGDLMTPNPSVPNEYMTPLQAPFAGQLLQTKDA